MKIEIISKDELVGIEGKLDQILALVRNAKNENEEAIYNTSELAKKLQVSTKTIQTWRDLKLIEFSRVNNKIYYTQKSLAEFLQKHSIKRTNRY